MPAPKTADFSAGLGAPYSAERRNLATEQALLLEALAQQQQRGFAAPGIRAGEVFVPDLGGLGSALSARSKRSDIETNRRKAADLEGRYQDELVKELRRYRDATDGGTVEAGAIDGSPVTQRTPGDPRAFTKFRDNPFPEVRAQAALAEELYRKQFEKLGDRASFQSLQQANGNIAALAPKRELTPLEGALMNVTEGQTPVVEPSTRVTQSTLPSGATVNNYASGKQGAVETAPKITTNIDNRAPGAMADKEFLEQSAKVLATRGSTLQTEGKPQLAALQSAEDALDKGSIQGPAAVPLQFVTGLLKQFGATTPELTSILANTEQIDASMGEFVLKKLKATGVNPSNADREFSERTAGGKKLSAEGFRAVIHAAKADIYNSYLDHNEQAEKMSSRFPSAQLAIIDPPSVFLGESKGIGRGRLPLGITKIPGYTQGEDGRLYRKEAEAPTPASATPSGYTPQQEEFLRQYGPKK